MEVQHSHPAHGLHAEHSVAMFRDKFWLCLALTLPVVYWSSEVQRSLGYRAPTFSGSRLIPAILGTFIFVYGGRVFIQGGRHKVSGHKPGMMTLISLGIVVAFAGSLISTLGIFEVDVWWELSTLVSVMLLGHWLEMKAVLKPTAPSRPLPGYCLTPPSGLVETSLDDVSLCGALRSQALSRQRLTE